MYTLTSWIRNELQEWAEPEYKKFQHSLIPDLDLELLGVRIPKLRELAKKAAKEGYEEFAQEADLSVYEEVMIRGMMIGYKPMTLEQQKEELTAFIPFLSNWAVCDSCCTTYKFMKKNQEEWFSFLQSYFNAKEEYQIRFAVVCLLDFFLNPQFVDRVLTVLAGLKQEKYYVKMAVAWALSSCYVKFPQKTERILKEDFLDDFTQNKTIQKIRESFRVSGEAKEHLKIYLR